MRSIRIIYVHSVLLNVILIRDISEGWNFTVHVENDFGEVDEYLSCIRLLDIVFKEFTDRLKDIDNIVCMVGDHGPSFTSMMAVDLKSDYGWLLRTSVPFAI